MILQDVEQKIRNFAPSESRIAQIEFYLPEQERTNADLKVMFPNVNPERIERKLGIISRHVAAAGETALDMAEKVCEKLFQQYDRNQIDYLLLCTQSPDYFLPTSACILQDRLNLRRQIGALDFNLGCSGYVYGLSLAKGLIAGNIARNVLLITSETYSKHIAPTDQGNMSLFGDGAAATVVEKTDREGIMQFSLGTDGRGFRNLIIENGALRSPKNGGEKDFLYMNGTEIVNFMQCVIPDLIADVLLRNRMQIDEIDHFIFHQANRYLLEMMRDELKIPEEKFHINLKHTGNTVSSSIPIVLKRMRDSGVVRPGETVLLTGYGVGYSYASTIIKC